VAELPSVTLTKIVMPGQTNALGTLFGGVALSLMDEAAAIVAIRHARGSVVTAHMNSVDFRAPVRLGEAVVVTATLRSVGRSSMRLSVVLYGEDMASGERRLCTDAEVVMVALHDDGTPREVAPLPR
jgi:acyl-CoA hydrolase